MDYHEEQSKTRGPVEAPAGIQVESQQPKPKPQPKEPGLVSMGKEVQQ
jgi:hypothetical protein